MERSDKNKEAWINGIMNSLEGMQRPGVPESVFYKIERKIGRKTIALPQVRVVPFRVISMAAAIIILLISVNLFFIARQFKTNSRAGEIEKVAAYYGLKNSNALDNL